MRLFSAFLLSSSLVATSALAGASISQVDQNGDGFATRTEMTVVYPTLTTSDFRALDTNRDNRLSNVELTANGASVVLNKHVPGGTAVLSATEVDWNGDGFASLSELSAAYPGFHQYDFDDIDLNRDHRISARELYQPAAQAIFSRYEAGPSILVEIQKVDTDQSNFAEFDELLAVYPKITTNDFHEIDLNRDNRVSAVELHSLNAIQVLGTRTGVQ